MSKRSKRRKTVEMREKNRDKNLRAELSAGNDPTEDPSQATEESHASEPVVKKAQPLLTIMLAASIVIVAAVSIIDFNHVYAEYLKVHEGIPAVMASLDAVREDIFPWTELTVYAAVDPGYVDAGPGVAKKTEAITEETETETETEVQPETQPEKETKAAETGTKSDTSSGAKTGEAEATKAETKASEAESVVVAKDASSNPTDPKKFKKVDMSYLSDAAFVGDSFTQGLMLYSDIPGADFLNYQSKTTRNIMDSDIHFKNGGVSTVRKELGKKQYGKIYILLGINELSNDAAGFAGRYQKVINEIRALQPGAIIYVQSILHTTPNKSAKSNFKNEIIDKSNQALAGLADNKTVFYVDLNPVFDDGTGAMRADYSADGVHMKASHYNEWRDYLLNFGVE